MKLPENVSWDDCRYYASRAHKAACFAQALDPKVKLSISGPLL